jgi:hypothetical protein
MVANGPKWKHVVFHGSAAILALLVGFGSRALNDRKSPAAEPGTTSGNNPAGSSSVLAEAPPVPKVAAISQNTIAQAYVEAVLREIAVTANSTDTADKCRARLLKALESPGYRFDLGNGKTISLGGAARLFAAAATLDRLADSSDGTARDTLLPLLADKIGAAAVIDGKDILRVISK